jgi:hypothetical protein
MLPNVPIVRCIYSGGNKLSDISKYLSYHKTRKGASVVVFITSGLLILSFIPIGTRPLFPADWAAGIRYFSVSTFVFLGVINYATPYITASIKSFKCLKCESQMATSELECQNCGCTFHFKNI